MDSNTAIDPAKITAGLIVNPLATLAAEINLAHDQSVASARTTIEHARRCGKLLIKAKAQLGHGCFGAWLATNCTVKVRQARNYMRLVENWERISKTAPGADLTVKSALRLLQADKPAKPHSSLPVGFEPKPGHCLIGARLREPFIAVYVGESLRNPGYWHVQLFDFQEYNAVHAGTHIGFQRPIKVAFLETGFDFLLRAEHLVLDEFEWFVGGDPEHVKHLRTMLDADADLLWNSANYWWLRGVR